MSVVRELPDGVNPCSCDRRFGGEPPGISSWNALLLGRIGNEPLFLQVEEVQPSVLEDYAGASEFATTASASSSASD